MSPLIGRFNADNLLAVLGVLVGSGRAVDRACDALAECRPPPGRLEVFGGGAGQPHVVVDYAHTPAALARVLDVLAQSTRGALICVFGCGGNRDRGKRALMGAAAAERADRIVLTDDNPRDEDPAAIVADIQPGLGGHGDVAVVHDRAAAVAAAVGAARPGDVVLVAGKGHETTQRIGDESRPLDDRALVAAALGGRS